MFDLHSCFVSLGPFAVTVNYRGDVGRETNPAPGPTLGGHGHVKKKPKAPHHNSEQKQNKENV